MYTQQLVETIAAELRPAGRISGQFETEDCFHAEHRPLGALAFRFT